MSSPCRVRKACVTDSTHPGLHVCFWGDAAGKLAARGARPGDIVRIAKVVGAELNGSRAMPRGASKHEKSP